MANANIDEQDDSDDSIIEVTPCSVKASNELLRVEKELSEETIYLLRMWNLPENCTPSMIVSFFAPAGKKKKVKVFLGEAGVIIQQIGDATHAFVLFKGFDDLNLGILRDNYMIGENHIRVEIITLFEAMIIWCHLRRKHDAIDHREKYILLHDLPVEATSEDIAGFLSPYNIWIEEKGPHPSLSVTKLGKTIGRVYRLQTELAAFVIYMKKNGSPLVWKGKEMFIQISLVSCCSSLEVHAFPSEKTQITRPIQVEDIVRCPESIKSTTSLVILKNLPRTITPAEIASLFRERILVSVKNISPTVPMTSSTVTTSIIFESEEEGVFAVNNMESFSFRNCDVTVTLTTITDV